MNAPLAALTFLTAPAPTRPREPLVGVPVGAAPRRRFHTIRMPVSPLLAWTILLGGLALSSPVNAGSPPFTTDLSRMKVGADPIPAPKVSPPPQPVFDVRSYGAKGDGSTYDTAAIQRAIDACAGTSGSVYLSHGKFLTAALELKGRMTFYVAPDAVLLGGLEPQDYPEVLPYTTEESVGVIWNRRSLLYANQAHDLRLEGGGTIDGRGQQVKMNGVGGPMSRNAGERPSVLRIFQSRNVIVRNLTVQNPRMWTMVFERCDDLLLEHLQVSAPAYYQNLDGIDVCDCHRVVIRRCVIESEDDSICLKSHSLVGLKDVLITNNVVTNHRANAIKVGTATLGPIENIRILNNTIKSAKLGGLCLESVDGSIVNNVVVRGLDLHGVAQPIFIRLAERPDWRKATPNHRPGPGAIANVLIENVRVTGLHDETAPSNTITGIKDARLRNITLRHVYLEMPGGVDRIPATPKVPDDGYPQSNIFGHPPAYGFYVRHADNVRLEDISIGFLRHDARPWLAFEDATVETRHCIDRRLIDRE
jgi:polygalacturonase